MYTAPPIEATAARSTGDGSRYEASPKWMVAWGAAIDAGAGSVETAASALGGCVC
jgi:hypothetical protein